MYYTISSDPFHDRGVLDEDIPEDVSLMEGAWINWQPEQPIVCTSNCDAENPPRQCMGGAVPIWSAELLKAFRSFGIDNIQAFPAVIVDVDGEMKWDNYYIINVLGLVAAADLASSEYIEIGEHPTGLPYVSFEELVVSESKIQGAMFFRLAESKLKLIIHQKVVDYLSDNPPESGSWGIIVDELESVE